MVGRGNRCCPHPKGVYERLTYSSLVKDKCKTLIMRFKSPGGKKKGSSFQHNLLLAVGNRR